MIELPTESEPVRVIEGDCLSVLRELPDGCVDAVVTDPPYCSGGMVRGDRLNATNDKYSGWGGGAIPISPKSVHSFTGDTRDQRSFAYWSALWMSEALRATKLGGICMCFTDWRQLPSVTDAIQAGGWVWRGVVVWDKGIARPMKGRFRNHVEYVVWASNGPIDGDANPVYLDGVFRVSPPPTADRDHLTEKPVELMRRLLEIVPKGGIVLDPFGGSGTTAAASVIDGRRCILIEKEPAYCDIARRRVKEAMGTGLLAGIA